MDGSSKVTVFSREYAKVDDRNIWADGQKWASLYQLLDEQKGKAEILAVSAPEVLGDTYRELILNLAAIGNAGMVVAVLPSKDRGEIIKAVPMEVSGIGTSEPVSKPVLQKESTSENQKPGEARMKRAGGMLVAGRKPIGTIFSTAPDETYAQAQLLLMLDKEMFRPSSQGREIQGFYDVSAGTMDELMQEYIDRPEDLKRLEQKRLEVLKNGWASFLVKPPEASEATKPPGVYHALFTKDNSLASEGRVTALKAKQLKEMIAKERSFQCMHCLKTHPDEKLERFGVLSVSGLFSSRSGPGKELVYPLCRACAALPETEMFRMVEKNLVEKSDELVAKLETSIKDAVKKIAKNMPAEEKA